MDPIGGEDPAAIYEFCCNIHILRAVKYVAIAGLVLNPFWGIFMLITSPITPYDFSLVFLCLYALILVAMRKENARLLIPFLIFNGILIAVRILYCVVVFFTINSQWFWNEWQKEHPGVNPTGEKVELALHLVFNILKVFLNIWFEHIVYRGYLYMLDRAEATPLLATTTNQSPVQNAQPPPIVLPGSIGYPQPNAPPPLPPDYYQHQPQQDIHLGHHQTYQQQQYQPMNV